MFNSEQVNMGNGFLGNFQCSDQIILNVSNWLMFILILLHLVFYSIS